MPKNPISDRAQKLIRDHIPSVLQLEILLFLYAARPRFLSLKELERPLAIEPAALNNQLIELARRGLVVGQTTPEVAFGYVSEHPDRDEAVRELAEAYSRYSVAVLNLIYGPRTDKIQALADAFRLRQDERESRS